MVIEYSRTFGSRQHNFANMDLFSSPVMTTTDVSLSISSSSSSSPTETCCQKWDAFFRNPQPEKLEGLTLEGKCDPFPETDEGRRRYQVWRESHEKVVHLIDLFHDSILLG